MSGPVVLHGGGEFEVADEACVSAVLALAGSRAAGGARRPIRVAVVPTATARWTPDRSAAHGVAAFQRVAAIDGLTIEAASVPVVDAAGAADPSLAERLAGADVIAFPGGDPDVIVTVMPGSTAWEAIATAHRAGAVLHGASAGAMAFATWTWTPDGGVAGLDVVPGLAVRPHVDAATWGTVAERFGAGLPAGLGVLGIPERTAAITVDPTTNPVTWLVVGEGEVRWLAVRGGQTVVTPPGATFTTPGRSHE